MRRLALALLLSPLLAASSVAQNGGEPLDAALRSALAEQNNADAATARLEQAAAKAQTEAGRLHAEQVAAAQAIEAAEARIGAASARLQLASAYVAAHRQRLATEQRPVSSLLGGLANMARRPPHDPRESRCWPEAAAGERFVSLFVGMWHPSHRPD